MTITDRCPKVQDPRIYNKIHNYFANNHKATYCSVDRTHKSKHYEWALVGNEYTDNPSDYKQMCISCHRKLDWTPYQREYHRKRMTGNTFRRKSVIQLTKSGSFIKKYPALEHAARETGVIRTSISNCISGRAKTAGGYRWRIAS